MKGLLRFLPQSEKLSKFYSVCSRAWLDFTEFLSKIADSEPFQLLVRHKDQIALFLYGLWIAGCGYWLYLLITLDVKPYTNWDLGINDSRDAMVMLFFGIIGFIFVLFFVFYVMKFIYNLFHDGIQSVFPGQWYPLAKSVCYLMVLSVAFSFAGNIKAAGLGAYNQVAELVQKSRQHDIIIEKKVPEDIERKVSELLKLMEEDKHK